MDGGLAWRLEGIGDIFRFLDEYASMSFGYSQITQ